LAFRDQRSAFALEALDRGVGVDADDEDVTEAGRRLQARQVSGVEGVEGAVRPDDRPPGRLPTRSEREQLVERDDASRRRWTVGGRDRRLDDPADGVLDREVCL